MFQVPSQPILGTHLWLKLTLRSSHGTRHIRTTSPQCHSKWMLFSLVACGTSQTNTAHFRLWSNIDDSARYAEMINSTQHWRYSYRKAPSGGSAYWAFFLAYQMVSFCLAAYYAQYRHPRHVCQEYPDKMSMHYIYTCLYCSYRTVWIFTISIVAC